MKANPMVPLPAQVPAQEGLAQLSDTQLFYWDTGGDGHAVLFLHPATGSAMIWGYQQPVFAKAGYRVIGYSRRGYYRSAPVAEDNPGIASEDLHKLVDFLGLKKFHLVSSAAGGVVASDYALSHQDRLLSLVIADNPAGIRGGEIGKVADSLKPKGFDAMAIEFLELGPSYRAAHPDGVKAWLELAHKALVSKRASVRVANSITDAALNTIKVPTLLITGAADLYTPPSVLRMVAAKIPNSEMVIAAEAGHSVHWETPELFNRVVLGFLAQHSK
jgi:pimeloyl-ACP methyl ester carboxylesterase